MRAGVIVVLALAWAIVAFPVAAEGTRVELGPDLFLEPITEGVWRHVSSKEMEGWGRVPANGLVVVSDGEAALLDTPWTDEHVRAIAKWLDETFAAKLTIAVPTHWHDDCLGGLAAAHELGAASYASGKTIELAKKGGVTVPENGFTGHLDLSVGSLIVTLEEAGPGHTVDNIVAWLPLQRVLFGGCLVKAAKSTGLGYIEEADMMQWPRSVASVASRFEKAAVVVPGHGAPGGLELLTHTKTLIENAPR